MPTPASLHTDAALTNLSVLLGTGSFAAAAGAPVFPVTKQSDKYYEYGREHVSDDVVQARAPGAPAPELDWKVTTATYTTKRYDIAHLIPSESGANADPAVDPRRATTRILRNRVFLAWEKRFKTLATTAGNFGSTVAAPVTWATGTADPEKDVDDAKEGVEKLSGYTPNTIVIQPVHARTLKRNTKVRDLVRYTDPTLLVNGDLPPVLWGLRVVIPGAIENTANPGQTASLARVWNVTTVALLYVDPNPSLEAATWALTFRWSGYGVAGQRVAAFNLPERDGEKIEYGLFQDEKLVSKECGALITGVS